MNFHEAIEMAKKGHRISHPYFMEDEYLTWKEGIGLVDEKGMGVGMDYELRARTFKPKWFCLKLIGAPNLYIIKNPRIQTTDWVEDSIIFTVDPSPLTHAIPNTLHVVSYERISQIEARKDGAGFFLTLRDNPEPLAILDFKFIGDIHEYCNIAKINIEER